MYDSSCQWSLTMGDHALQHGVGSGQCSGQDFLSVPTLGYCSDESYIWGAMLMLTPL